MRFPRYRAIIDILFRMRIAGGVGGAEAAVLAHAADIAGGAALGVVDFAVEQADHRGHALGGHEQAGRRDGKPDEPRGVERSHD